MLDESFIDQIRQVIFHPFYILQQGYSTLEKQYILQQSNNLEMVYIFIFSYHLQNFGNDLDTVEMIDTSISPLFLTCEKAIMRCIQFTDGVEIIGLVAILNVQS